jgi:hypothetical protein
VSEPRIAKRVPDTASGLWVAARTGAVPGEPAVVRRSAWAAPCGTSCCTSDRPCRLPATTGPAAPLFVGGNITLAVTAAATGGASNTISWGNESLAQTAEACVSVAVNPGPHLSETVTVPSGEFGRLVDISSTYSFATSGPGGTWSVSGGASIFFAPASGNPGRWFRLKFSAAVDVVPGAAPCARPALVIMEELTPIATPPSGFQTGTVIRKVVVPAEVSLVASGECPRSISIQSDFAQMLDGNLVAASGIVNLTLALPSGVGEDCEDNTPLLDSCIGACCVGGTCSLKTLAECSALNGDYFGAGSQCAAVTCDLGAGPPPSCFLTSCAYNQPNVSVEYFIILSIVLRQCCNGVVVAAPPVTLEFEGAVPVVTGSLPNCSDIYAFVDLGNIVLPKACPSRPNVTLFGALAEFRFQCFGSASPGNPPLPTASVVVEADQIGVVLDAASPNTVDGTITRDGGVDPPCNGVFYAPLTMTATIYARAVGRAGR